MCPTLLQIDLFGLRIGLSLFGLFLGLAGGVGAAVVAGVGRSAGLPSRSALAMCFWASAAGVIAARLGAMILGSGGAHGMPLGLSYAAGLAAATGAVVIYSKRRQFSPWTGLDLLACGLAAASSIVALGCFAGGCCYGDFAPPSAAPFAAQFGQDTVAWRALAERGVVPLAAPATPPLYAVQLFEAAGFALVAGALIACVRRPRRGYVFGAYLLAAAAVWLALWPWRASPLAGAATAVVLALAGIALTLGRHAYARFTRRDRRGGPGARGV